MSMNLNQQIAVAAAMINVSIPRGLWQQYDAAMQARRQRDIYLIQLIDLTGLTRTALEGYSNTFNITIAEMHYYYCFFGKLPEVKYITVIRHIGVENLVKAVLVCSPHDTLYPH